MQNVVTHDIQIHHHQNISHLCVCVCVKVPPTANAILRPDHDIKAYVNTSEARDRTRDPSCTRQVVYPLQHGGKETPHTL